MNRALCVFLLLCLVANVVIDVVESQGNNGCDADRIKQCERLRCQSPCCRDGECRCKCGGTS